MPWLVAGCLSSAGPGPPNPFPLRSRRGGAWGGSGPFVCSPAPPRPAPTRARGARQTRAADTSGRRWRRLRAADPGGASAMAAAARDSG